MAELIVFRQNAEEPQYLISGDVCYLDRKFLTGAEEDDTISARHAPKLFSADGGWIVLNQTPNQTLVLWGPKGNVDRIGPGMARMLEDDYSELQVEERRVGLSVHGTVIAPPPAPGPAAPITTPPDGDAEKALRALLESKPWVRTVMYVRFQQYISARPEHVHNPEPLRAADVLACYPDAQNKAAVDQACREIRDVTRLTLWEIGPWLVERGILLRTHNIDIPHTECQHRVSRQ